MLKPLWTKVDTVRIAK